MKLLPLLAGASLLMFACNETEEISEPAVQESLDLMENDTDSDYDWEELELPTPGEMANMLKFDGVQFNAANINNGESLDKYATKSRQAFNFGGFLSDLTYCLITNEESAAQTSLRSLIDLSGQLGLEEVFQSEAMVSQLSASMGDADSLELFMEDLEYELDGHIADNDMMVTEAMIYTGGWIESMYIGSEQRSTLQNEVLEKRLIKHMKLLNDLLPAVKNIPDRDQFLNGMIAGLQQLHELFQGFDIITKVDADENVGVSQEEWDALYEKIREIRSLMVS